MTTASTPPPSPTCGSASGTLPSHPQTPSIDWPRTPSPVDPSSTDVMVPGVVSALNTSLQHVVNDPLAIGPNLMDKIAVDNNPRPLRELVQDSAQYWVTTDNQLLHIKFPAKVDRTGQFERLGPYFNMASTGLDVLALQKARAQFELVPLDEKPDEGCLGAAIECSRAFFTTLFVFFDEVESRQAGGQNTSITPFWRTYELGRGDHYALVVTTDALFANLPRVNNLATPKVTHADIGKSSVLLSPSKARAAALAKANEDSVPTHVEAAHRASGPKILRISDLPDPHGRYARLLKTYSGLADAKVTTLDVRDRQGLLITPAQYDDKISDGDIVEVEVILKLWSIQPKPKGNPNGSRVYQTILRSMRLLPFHAYSQQNIFGGRNTRLRTQPPVDKGKRKADDNDVLVGQSPSKNTEVE